MVDYGEDKSLQNSTIKVSFCTTILYIYCRVSAQWQTRWCSQILCRPFLEL